MQEPIARLVHPVLAHGLHLSERLRRGESPDLDNEQAVLKDLLLSDAESRRWSDFGGDAGSNGAASGESSRSLSRPPISDAYLGIRYALVCWLDELFCSDESWGPRWTERKLEVELYGTNDRAWRFWQQARLAQARPGVDALEAFYLCVTLGFRGQLSDRPEELSAWLSAARVRLGNVHEPDWIGITQLPPVTSVPPLTGRRQFERMLVSMWVALLALIPLSTFVLVRRLAE